MKLIPKFVLDRLPKRVALRAEPPNVAGSATARTVTAAIRSAESGETRQLFSLYRDIIVGDSHVQAEFSKRKLALLGDTLNILPRDKNNPEDVRAAEAIRRAIEDCDGWMDSLTFALDSCLYPVSVLQKVFRPADPGTGLRMTLKKLEPVHYAVLCLREPWIKGAPATEPDVEPWEPDLRFFPVDDAGNIQYFAATAEPADPNRHLVHRGHLLVGIRDAWGGPMRAVTAWWLLGVLGREWFGRFMERFGNPFILGKTDSTNKEAVEFLQEALSLSTKIGGLVVDHETEVELKEAMLSGGADAYDKFLSICNREKSKLIVGQELSATAAATGLGSGVANLQSQVRDDIRMFDQIKLAETLEKQLFKQILQVNGLHGAVPRVRWGGLSAAEAEATGALLVSLSNAGLEPTDDALPGISERVGFEIQRKIAAPAPAFGGVPFSAITTLAAGIPKATDPTDKLISARAKALGEAYRGAMAPFRQIILSSTSKQDCLQRLQAFYPDWKPERLEEEFETAMQLCAAAGAAAAKN